jgi:uroporphyrinogen decarboxylase
MTDTGRRRGKMKGLDVVQFWKDDEEAHKDNCFNPKAKQVAFGLNMNYECVYMELGVDTDKHPWEPRPIDVMRGYIKMYNDKAEEIVGRRLLREEFLGRQNVFPHLKRVGDIFEGRYFFKEYVEWLDSPVTNAKELEALLDRVEKLDLEAFIVSENWDAECKRIYGELGIKPEPHVLDGRSMRGPCTAAVSLFGAENILLLYYDSPELFSRFGYVIGEVMLKRTKIIDKLCGYTEENHPKGFLFNDDNCCLFSPEMYEVFGYPVLKKIFDYCSPDEGDLRYQHSDSDMAHLIPLLAKLNLTGVNFGPTVTFDKIRPYMPRTRVDGCIAPLVFARNDEEELVRQVKRDCGSAVQNNWRGLNLGLAGSTSYGSRLSGYRLVMQAIQNFGQYC